MEDHEDHVAKVDAVDQKTDPAEDKKEILPATTAQKNSKRDKNETEGSNDRKSIHTIRLFARISRAA